jgi:hypothetical protein
LYRNPIIAPNLETARLNIWLSVAYKIRYSAPSRPWSLVSSQLFLQLDHIQGTEILAQKSCHCNNLETALILASHAQHLAQSWSK